MDIIFAYTSYDTRVFTFLEKIIFLTISFRIIDVGIVNVRYSDYKYPHLADGSMDHTGRYVNHGAGSNLPFLAIENDFARSFQNVIKLGGPLVVVRFCPVDVHCMGPCCDVFVVLADETIAVPTGAAFLDGLVLVSEEQVARQTVRGI